MDILKELHSAKSCDSFYHKTNDLLYDVRTKSRAEQVSIIGYARPTRWDKQYNNKELYAINFYTSNILLRQTNETKENFQIYSREVGLNDCNKIRNFQVLIRTARIKKYFSKIDGDLSLEDAKKLFGRLFYCLTIVQSNGKFVIWDFVSGKKDILDHFPDWRIGFYYNPKFGDKVLRFWEEGFKRKYIKRCDNCGEQEIIAYKEQTIKLTTVSGYDYCDNCLKKLNYGKSDISRNMGFRKKLKFSCKDDKKKVLSKLRKQERKDVYYVNSQELFSKGIGLCDKCGCAYVIKDDKRLCSECKLTVINQYGDKRYKFMSVKGEQEKMFFGTECEIEVQGSLDKCSKILNKELSDMIYLKSDASIGHGFEIVSYAMTYKKWAHTLRRFKDVYQQVIDKGGYSERASTTGLHIHISRAGFKDVNHLARFARCFYLDKEFTRTIACRDFNGYACWNDYRANTPDYFNRALGNLISASFDDRYHIVNFRNNNTVEIRMFNGTLRADVIFAYIQFCKLLVDYTKDIETVDKNSMIDFINKNAKSKVLKGLMKIYDLSQRFSLKEVQKCA